MSFPRRGLTLGGRVLLCLLATSVVSCRGETPPARSLIVVCIDTLRADHVHSYGYERETTPEIDAFAELGTRFDRALSTSNWTVPAVASVLTSTLPSRHGAGVAGEIRNLDKDPPTPIAPGVQTLAGLLKARGFRTGLFSANPFLYGSFKQSFDAALVNRVPGAEIVDAAVDWISRHPEERTFLYLQLMDPHQPNLPPEPYFEFFATPGSGSREKRHSDWSFGAVVDLQEESFLAFREHRVAAYDGSIRYADAQVGRLLRRIEALGMLRDSVVVIFGDHGEEFWDHAFEQAGPRDDPRGCWGIGHGHTMYQELIRVPLIIRRGDRAMRSTIDCPVSLLDVAPTALAMLGYDPPAAMEGRSLVALLEGREECPRRALVAESPAYGPDSAALVYWPFKLVRRGGVSQLYDLDDDPGERFDLSERETGTRQRMEVALQSLLQTQVRPEAAPKIDPETLRQLRALGYLDH